VSTGTSLIRTMLVAGGVGGASLAAPAAVGAQAKLELVPFFASFYTLTNIAEFEDTFNNITYTERQTSAPGVGGRLRYWASPKLGIEAAVSYSWSGTRFASDDTADVGSSGLPGNLLHASGRVLYRPARTNLHLIAGVGMIQRGGETWDFDFIDQKTSVGGVVGFGVRATVTPKLALEVGLEANLYKADPDGSDDTVYESKFQTDLLVTIGIPFALAR